MNQMRLSIPNESTDLENRTIDLHELRIDAEGDQPIIRAAIKFNTLSVPLWGFREKIAPSAFDGALNDETKEVLAYWNHNTDLPLGRRSAATVEISKTKTLFKAAIVPNMDTEWGRSAVASIKRNDVKGMSFGFRVLPDGDQWDEDDDRNLIRTLLKVDLAEVSPTANPAYPNSSAKIRSEDDINEIRDALRFANKSITSDAVAALLSQKQARADVEAKQLEDRQRRDRLQRTNVRQFPNSGG
jgi:HK97 family phage prohead protease